MNNTLTRRRIGNAVAAVAVMLTARAAAPAELHPRTVAAFDRYVQLTEARMTSDTRFLWIETLPEVGQRSRLAQLQQGGLVIERMTTRESGKEIDVPDGLIHHWVGLTFVPGATLASTLALLQDYDHHAEIYRPTVQVQTDRARR